MKGQKGFDLEAAKKALAKLDANVLINGYALENFVFGRIKSGEQLPVGQYLGDMGKFITDVGSYEFADGYAVENCRLKELDYDKACFLLYRDKIDYIFTDAPQDEEYDEDDDIRMYKHGLYEYLKELYGMYRAILATEVYPDLFAALPDIMDREEQRDYYLKITQFVTAIKLKKLKGGANIDRYIRDMPFISPIIMRLIEKKGGKFVLKNIDTDGMDYKMALFSCFRFFNEDNSKLFELKMLRYEELNKA